MEMHIGNRKIVASAKLLIPENETAWIAFDHDGWKIKVNIVLDKDNNNGKARFDFKGMGDYAELRLFNWDEKFPFVIDKYIDIGATPTGKSIYLLFYGVKFGTVHNIDLAFIVEA